jgi:exosortase
VAVGEASPRVDARAVAAATNHWAGPATAPGAKLRAPEWIVSGILFLMLYWATLADTANNWLSNPDAGHGLLLVPVAIFLAWKAGIRSETKARPVLGAIVLLLSVAVRYLSGLATGYFFMRVSLLGALVGLILFVWGYRQILHWWLPLGLVTLSMPLPDILLSTLALPLQMQASQMGAALLDWRDVPVLLTGNVIHLPGHQLFVTEACSGLRSLSALLALGLLIGGMWLQSPLLRSILFLASIPIGIVLNGIRVFLTGFFVYFVDPAIGEGLMHYTEGWVIFVVALGIQGGVALLLARLEQATRKVPS